MADAASARLPLVSVGGLSEMVRERLLLAKLAGAAVWLAWLVSLAVGGWTHDATGHPTGADHVQYYVVGRLIADGRSDLVYDIPTMTEMQKDIGGERWEGMLPFRYPPFYAIVYSPTSRLPYLASFVVWTVLSLMALLAAAWALGVEDRRSWMLWALCFYPVFAAVSFGQNSLFSLALFALVFALWQRNRTFAAGLVAGLLLFKPQLLVGLGPLWLLDWRRSWRALAGMTVTLLLLAAASAALVPGASVRFVSEFAAILRMHSSACLHQLHSTQGFWMLLLPHHAAAAKLLSIGSSLLGLVALVVLYRRCRDDRPVLFAGTVLLTLWISPYAMIYDWSILLVAATLLWRHVPDQQPRWRLLFAAVWLVSFVSGPLVRGQESVLPFAIQISVPVLAAVLVAAWYGLRSPRVSTVAV